VSLPELSDRGGTPKTNTTASHSIVPCSGRLGIHFLHSIDRTVSLFVPKVLCYIAGIAVTIYPANKKTDSIAMELIGWVSMAPELTVNTVNAAVKKDKLPSLTIPNRVIPVPDTVSPALQKLIGQRPDEATLQIPQTSEEWRALIAQMGSSSREIISKARDKFGVIVEPKVIGGVNCYFVKPNVAKSENRDRLLLGLHGGAFVCGAGESGLLEALEMSGLTSYNAIAVDYRMPPDHPFPAAMDDVMTVWKEVIKLVKPGNIGMFGTSAGGGLVLSLVQRAQREGVPLPGAIVAGTPWSDLSKTGDSYYTNAGLSGEYDGLLAAAAKLYANGRNLKDPLLSPVYGRFTGFPPTFLLAGTRDLFLSNTVRVHSKLLEGGAKTHLEIQEGQAHGQFLMAALANAPEGAELYSHIKQFLDTYLDGSTHEYVSRLRSQIGCAVSKS
jgi:monoterpene epsilon-lactone hydrolase